MDGQKTRGRRERGASAPEYALIVGAIAVLAFGALRVIGDSSDSSFQSASAAIASGPAHNGGGGGGSPTSTAVPPTTVAPNTTAAPTTTAAPATTVALTTTTAPPTTTAPATTVPTAPTTVAPTTTLPALRSQFTTISAVESKKGDTWDAEATLAMATARGQDLDKADVIYRVTFTVRGGGGGLVTVIENRASKVKKGVAVLDESGNPTTASKTGVSVVSVQFDVLDVLQKDVADLDLWDGFTSSVRVNAPDT